MTLHFQAREEWRRGDGWNRGHRCGAVGLLTEASKIESDLLGLSNGMGKRERQKRKSHELAEQKGKWILFCFIFILVCFAHGVFFHYLVLDVIAVLKY